MYLYTEEKYACTVADTQKGLCTHVSNALEDLIIDGVLQLHSPIERVGLVILDQFCETVKLGGAYHVVTILDHDTTVTNFGLRSV